MKKIFKKTLSIFLTLLILLSIAPTNIITNASATDDRIKWTFDGETLVVSGSGELSTEYTSTAEWNAMKDKCKNVRIEGEITAIGKSAFNDFTALEKVEVLSELETVGAYAFYECTELTEIILPDSVTLIDMYAFAECVSIVNFEFPKNLTRINQWAFQDCNCFDGKNMVLPDTLQKISLGSFSGANITSLTTPFVGVGPIDWEDSGGTGTYHIGYIFGDEKFEDSYSCYDSTYKTSYSLPKSLKEVTITKNVYEHNFESAKEIEKIIIKDTVELTSIPSYFAKNCVSLNEIVIENSDNIKYIGAYALSGCISLEHFTIPQNVTQISNHAFANCVFNSIELPDKLEEIGIRAFQNCKNITSIVIPESVTTIADYAFIACSNLENVILPENTPKIGKSAFAETKYAEKMEENSNENDNPDFSISKDGTLLAYFGTDENVIVPDGVKRIGTVFAENKNIKSIVLPDGLEEIDYRAFDGCKGITELVIPDSVTTINEGAFAGMCNLTKLTVPFVGKSRDVETDTREALIGYWFSWNYENHDCIYNCYGGFVEIKQIYNNTNYQRYSYKPRYFKELTVTDSVLRSNALQNYNLKVLTLGENVKGIEEYAANKLGLEELYFDENIKITEIPDYAFCNNNLTSVTIPRSVKRIGKAFICDYYPNNKLAEINLNEGLEVIDGSFAGSKITSIDLPKSLKKILKYSFRNCTKLKSIEFPENLIEIGDWAFDMSPILEEVIFSDSIEKIGSCAFLDCPVKKVVIPESMKDIVDQTFYECDELEIVVIGGNVTEIGPQAFADCPLLETVVIPDSVTSISNDAFENANENLVIYCNEGSYAQSYAAKNNIKHTTLVIDPIENQKYTGKEIKPEVNASANNRRLTQGAEYTVTYKDNINVGIAKITAKGLGDFKHLAATAKFTILPRAAEDVRVLSGSSTYCPEGVEPELYVMSGTQRLVEDRDYEVLNKSVLKEVGEYNITVALMGNYDGVINVNYKISRRSIKSTDIEYGDTVKIICEGVTLKEGKDYTVTKETNENGDVITTVEGIGNYKGSDTHTEKNGNNQTSLNWFQRFIDAIRSLFDKLFNIGL